MVTLGLLYYLLWMLSWFTETDVGYALGAWWTVAMMDAMTWWHAED